MGPPVFKGKRKKGIFMSKLKPKSYKRKRTSTGRSPHKSPATKRMSTYIEFGETILNVSYFFVLIATIVIVFKMQPFPA
jgi:hypothetical protein